MKARRNKQSTFELNFLIAAMFSLPLIIPAAAADWQPAAGPLKTRGEGRVAGARPAGVSAATDGPQGLAESQWLVGH